MSRGKAEPLATAVPVDPPQRVHGKYDWPKIAKKLRAQPMQWHKVFDDDRHSRVISAKGGSVAAVHPEAGFEYQTSNTHYPESDGGKRHCTLYMRYNPDTDKRSND